MNAQAADLVVTTGDFVTNTPPDSILDDLTTTLSMIKQETLAVFGNHDYWSGPDSIRKILVSLKISEIANKVHTIRRGSASLHICGVDDIWENKVRLDLVQQHLPDSGAAILLAHEPDYADISAQVGRFDLHLSGHSQGGQVNLPFLGLVGKVPMTEQYISGLYQVGTM